MKVTAGGGPGGRRGRCWSLRNSEQGPVVGLTVLLIVSFLTVKSDRRVLVDEVRRGVDQ